jgi:hypothetical protein
MVTKSFIINFQFPYPSKDGYIDMSADVEKHHSETYYIVNKFRLDPHKSGDAILPPISIKKVSGIWVHKDTNKETELSLLVGMAIDKVISGSRLQDEF